MHSYRPTESAIFSGLVKIPSGNSHTGHSEGQIGIQVAFTSERERAADSKVRGEAIYWIISTFLKFKS